MKNSLQGLNSICRQVEVRINRFGDISLQIIQPKEQKKKLKQNKQSLREMWDTIKHSNICVMGVSEGKGREEQKKHSKK